MKTYKPTEIWFWLYFAAAGAIAVILVTQTGCMGGSLAKVVRELKNDPATVNVRVVSIYGTVNFTRTAPGTNSATHSILPDGTVKVEKAP